MPTDHWCQEIRESWKREARIHAADDFQRVVGRVAHSSAEPILTARAPLLALEWHPNAQPVIDPAPKLEQLRAFMQLPQAVQLSIQHSPHAGVIQGFARALSAEGKQCEVPFAVNYPFDLAGSFTFGQIRIRPAECPKLAHAILCALV